MNKITFFLSTIILVNQVKAEDKYDPTENQKVRLDQHFKKIPKHRSSWDVSYDDPIRSLKLKEIEESNDLRFEISHRYSNNTGTAFAELLSGAALSVTSPFSSKKFKKFVGIGTGTYLAIDGVGRLYCISNDLDAGFSPALGVAGWSVREINEFFTDLPNDVADLMKSIKAEHGKNALADGVTIDDYFKNIDEVEQNTTADVSGISGEIGAGALLVYKNFKNKAAADTFFKKASSWMKIGVGVYAVYDGTSRVIAHIEDLDGGLSAAASMTSYLYGKSQEALGKTPTPKKEPRKGVIESLVKGTVEDAEKTIKGDFNK